MNIYTETSYQRAVCFTPPEEVEAEMAEDLSRLPSTVRPEHYDLYLQPEFDNCTFSGRVQIRVEVLEPVDRLVLNARDFRSIHLVSLVRRAAASSTSTLKRKRDFNSEDEPEKRTRPCPGRFKSSASRNVPSRQSSTSELHSTGEELPSQRSDTKDQPTKNAEERDCLASKPSEHASPEEPTEPASSAELQECQTSTPEPPVPDTALLAQPVNTNIIVEKKGMVLLRSEWKEPDSSSEEEGEEDKSIEAEQEENNSEESLEEDYEDEEKNIPEETISSDEENDLVVSIDDDDDEDEEVCAVKEGVEEEEDDDEAVMQVDGVADGEVSEEVGGGVEEVDGGLEEVDGGVEEVGGVVEEVGGGVEEVGGCLEEVDGGVADVGGGVEEDSEEHIQISSVRWNKKQETLFIIPMVEPLKAGSYLLSLEFCGDLDDSLRGFYRTKHTVLGQVKWGAACHFEATGARKCFPCFDQPEFRATFDISVKRPERQMEVLSNMPAVSTKDEVVTFDRTPAMPSYLVCVIVGYYDSISRRTEDGVQITLYTQMSQICQVEHALVVAQRVLTFYKQFFGIGYTLPKMDLVAVPDFYIGAMENWGLLTFRETALMYHPTASTLSRKQYVAILVAHEVAHQWFGDLVSIAWWDQLWLKEGFATWISFLAVDHMFPEFDIWSDFMKTERLEALELDSLESSHPIQVTVNHPGQIDEIFDAISYSKGASIINMLYHWVGEKVFMSGMNRYLVEHKNSSAATVDLWRALDFALERDGPRVDEVMDQWTTWKGFPKISVSVQNTDIVVRQLKTDYRQWKVPLKVEQGDYCETILLGETPHTFTDNNGLFPLVNVGQTSFCRILYQDSLLARLKSCIKDIDTRDRVGILSDLCGAVVAGSQNVEGLLDLLLNYSGETDWLAVDSVLSVLNKVEQLTSETRAWTGFLQMSYSILEPMLSSLGWESRPEDGNMSLSRAAVIQYLGRLGHSTTGGESQFLWRRESQGKEPVHKDIRAAVYKTVARTGGRKEMEFFLERFKTAERSEEAVLYLSVLASFTDLEIMEELLDWSLTEDVKLQNKVAFITGCAATGLEGRMATWQFFKGKMSTLQLMYTSGSQLIRLVKGVTGHFNSIEMHREVQQLFKENEVAGARKTVDQCLEDILLRADRRAQYKDSLLKYMGQFTSSAQSLDSQEPVSEENYSCPQTVLQ